MSILKPLKDNILFTWLDAEEDDRTTASGIIISKELSGSKNRWGRIIAVGPLSNAKVGEFILCESEVEAWGAKHPDDPRCNRDPKYDVWRVRDENVIAVTSDYNVTLPIADNRKHTGVAETFHL